MTTINHDLRSILHGLLAAGALGVVSLNATAQSVPAPGAFDAFMYTATGAGKTTVSFGSAGTPLISPGVPTLAPDGGPGVKVTATGNWRNPSGNHVPVTGVARVSNAKLAGILGRFAVKVATPLAIGNALYDLLTEMGYVAGNTPDGKLAISQPSPNYCAVASGCAAYQWNASFNFPILVSTNPSPNCSWFLGKTGTSPSYGALVIDTANQNGNNCDVRYTYWGGAGYGWASANRTGTTLPYNPEVDPVSYQQFVDAVAAKSGWPVSSAIARAAVAAGTALGEKLVPDAPTVTGPATTPGKTVTKTEPNPDGSTKTTTTTTTHNHTYEGATITTNNTSIVNITNNGEAGKTTESTETDTPDKEDLSECERHPDSVGCAELDTPEQSEIPKTTKALTYVAESLGLSGGSCPSPIVKTVRGHSVTVFDYATSCGILETYVKPLVLLLSAWIAFFILMPGRNET